MPAEHQTETAAARAFAPNTIQSSVYNAGLPLLSYLNCRLMLVTINLAYLTCKLQLECSTATRSEHAFSSRLPPRTEDRSVPVGIP